MREIKFRAWKESEKRMLYWEELCTAPASLVDALNRIYLHDVMQYTGLKDKNGKEVYEGDILESSGFILPITVDDFHGYRFMYGKDYLCKAYAYYGEVIGNIYENPELLI